MWWKEKIQLCKKHSTVLLVKRLTYSNLLGLDVTLKNGRYAEFLISHSDEQSLLSCCTIWFVYFYLLPLMPLIFPSKCSGNSIRFSY
ncbi:hypothetical protein BHE74_00058861 [Ensete ventricosum]|nr:hypothetical protein BHE74_00058861 [Ensete ventricosum]RZS28338.1 hypothetical protein BHM03_00061919 [Ensete ventricosum]